MTADRKLIEACDVLLERLSTRIAMVEQERAELYATIHKVRSIRQSAHGTDPTTDDEPGASP